MSALRPPVSGSDHRAGPEQAAVTLVEYGDFECPHCAAAQPIVHEVRRRLGDRLCFVFRHFPLSELHPHAERAAEAAEAAGAQGRFWEMQASLFAAQDALEDEDLAERAAALGLDVARFRAELHDGTHRSRVRKDFQSGVRSGVNATPTFFIDGVRHDGAWDAETLVRALTRSAAEA
ncbi:MAG TPA: thioredoxin domain-containing protein [Planctomycetota bacterium]|nr:thioredoxin domain-containing protein [Planctomycetota bacterium]